MKRFLILLFVFFICACELIVDVDVPFDGEQLVVNSFIDPDSLWSASISLNRFILTHDTIPYKKVENATVTIHDENGLVATLQHVGDGRYRSQTEKPQTGKQYTFHASAPNCPAVEAKSMIPIAATITSVETETTVGDDESTMIFKIKFTDNGDTKDFYDIRIDLIYEDYKANSNSVSSSFYPEPIRSANPELNTQFISANGGLLVKDILFNGEQIEVRARLSHFFGGYAGMRVILRSVSEDYYDYHTTGKLQHETSGDPFAQPVNVYNNITNGFGIFAGFSSSTFDYYYPQPVITEISPASGRTGDIITITGQNFSQVAVGFKSQYGGTLWTGAVVVTDTQLRVVVPFGAVSGKLLVRNLGSLTLSDLEFQVTD